MEVRHIRGYRMSDAVSQVKQGVSIGMLHVYCFYALQIRERKHG